VLPASADAWNPCFPYSTKGPRRGCKDSYRDDEGDMITSKTRGRRENPAMQEATSSHLNLKEMKIT